MTVPTHVLLGNSGPSKPVAVKPALGKRYDLRTKQGRLHRERLVHEALQLREMGLSFKDVAAVLGVSPEWAAANVWFKSPELASGDRYVLADRRHAVAYNKDPDEVTAKRRARQWKHWRDGEWERVLKGPSHHTIYLDSPIRGGNKVRKTPMVVGDVVPAPETANPQHALEQAELRELLGDISIADVEKMDSHTLEHYREKLRDAGYAGWGRSVLDDERKRLRAPEPLDAVSGRPDRLLIPAEDDEADLMLHGTGSKKDRKALAQSRKARQDQDKGKIKRNRGKQRARWRGYQNALRQGKRSDGGLSDDFRKDKRG